jgi:hypothetical protein
MRHPIRKKFVLNLSSTEPVIRLFYLSLSLSLSSVYCCFTRCCCDEMFITSATYFPWFHSVSIENEQSRFQSNHIEQTLNSSIRPWLKFQRRYDATFGRLTLRISSLIFVLSMNRDFSFCTFLCFRILSIVPLHRPYMYQSPSWADNIGQCVNFMEPEISVPTWCWLQHKFWYEVRLNNSFPSRPS